MLASPAQARTGCDAPINAFIAQECRINGFFPKADIENVVIGAPYEPGFQGSIGSDLSLGGSGDPGPGSSGVAGATPTGEPVPKPLTPDCQKGEFIQDISLLEWSDGSLKISITPVESVRRGGAIANIANMGAVTAGADLGLKSCVAELGGLDTSEFVSIYQQLECHVQFEAGFLLVSAGPTWDLESWRVPLERADRTGYATSECLNTR